MPPKLAKFFERNAALRLLLIGQLLKFACHLEWSDEPFLSSYQDLCIQEQQGCLVQLDKSPMML